METLGGAEPGDGAAEAVVEGHRWLPPQYVLGAPDIGPADFGIVYGEGPVFDRAATATEVANALSQLEHADLIGVAQVDRIDAATVEEPDDARDEVVHIAQAASLAAVTIHRDGRAPKRLSDERGDRATVVGSHPRAVSVENPGDASLEPVGTLVGHGEGLGRPLGLVVHAPRPDRVHIPPVGLRLGTDLRIAVHLRGRRQEEDGLFGASQPKQIVRSQGAYLQRGDGVLRVIHWGRRR